MTGHFVTACRCERYISGLNFNGESYYRIPIYAGVHPTDIHSQVYSYSLFEKVSVDYEKNLIEYREVVSQ
jgi:hypothetical protein